MKRLFSILSILLVCIILFTSSLFAAEASGSTMPVQQEVPWLLFGTIIASGTFLSIVSMSWKYA